MPLGSVQGYAFTLGASGNRERIDESGGISRAYGYDALYGLTSETVTVGGLTEHSRMWTYDDVGNRQQQVTTLNVTPAPGVPIVAGTLDYAYAVRDRLLTEMLAGGGTTSSGYDANGNLTTKSGGTTYTWDFENRLTKVQPPDGTLVETAYDVDGNRVQTKTTLPGQATKVTTYLVDTSGALSHVVAEIDGTTTTLEALYVRGSDELLALMRLETGSTSGWQTRFYHADGIGSVRRLTDETGALIDTYTCSAFGELLVHTGSDPQPYAFTGEPYDPNVGFQYHRARWMDPRVGRFQGMDPHAGNAFDPASIHRYSYAAVDPINKVDPTGEFTVVEASFLVAIVAILALAFVRSFPASQNVFGGGNRIAVVGFEWQNEFTLGPERLSADEVELVKLWAYQTMRLAFSGYRVVVTEGGAATNHMIVKAGGTYNDYAGSTITGSTASEINYDVLADRALAHATNRQDRRVVAEGVGRGIGATAAHEFGHQIPLRWMDTTRDPKTYDFHSSNRPQQYYGQLHWLPANVLELQQKLSY